MIQWTVVEYWSQKILDFWNLVEGRAPDPDPDPDPPPIQSGKPRYDTVQRSPQSPLPAFQKGWLGFPPRGHISHVPHFPSHGRLLNRSNPHQPTLPSLPPPKILKPFPFCNYNATPPSLFPNTKKGLNMLPKFLNIDFHLSLNILKFIIIFLQETRTAQKITNKILNITIFNKNYTWCIYQ